MNLKDYDAMSSRYLAGRVEIFQSFLVENSEEKTIKEIYNALSPEKNSLVLDMGCGIGGVAKRMLEIDDTLKFLCVTNSKFQADYIENLYHKSIASLLADFSNVPLPDCSIDYIMFNESIGYGNLKTILTECYRLLRTGGRVLIKDFLFIENNEDYKKIILDSWDYEVRTKDCFLSAAKKAGLTQWKISTPLCRNTKYANFVRSDPYMRVMFYRYGNASEEVDYDIASLFLTLIKNKP